MPFFFWYCKDRILKKPLEALEGNMMGKNTELWSAFLMSHVPLCFVPINTIHIWPSLSLLSFRPSPVIPHKVAFWKSAFQRSGNLIHFNVQLSTNRFSLSCAWAAEQMVCFEWQCFCCMHQNHLSHLDHCIPKPASAFLSLSLNEFFNSALLGGTASAGHVETIPS